MRLNIDRQMHLAWPWAANQAYRGYVGREDFQGRQDVGKACDLVYPEYILELVRKLNLLLEIMRGTGPICDAESERQSGAQIDADAKAGIGAPAMYTHHATLLINVTANTGKAAYVACRAPLLIAQAVKAVSGIGAPIYYSRMISVPISVAGQSKQGVPMRVLPLSYMTSVYAEAMSCLPIPFGASCGISCGVNAAARLAMPLPATVNGVMALSYVSAEPQLGTSLPTSARTMASSTASVGKIDFLRSAPVVCAGGSRSKASCNMSDTAWLPPVWVNGGLWIRQVHDDPVQRDNGDLEVT